MDSEHEAGIFEHVAKMSRISDDEPPEKKQSSPPARFKSSVHPVSDLSSLPLLQQSALVGMYGGESDTSDERIPVKIRRNPLSSQSSVDSSVADRVEIERQKNKQRQREKIRQGSLSTEKDSDTEKENDDAYEQRKREIERESWQQAQQEIDDLFSREVPSRPMSRMDDTRNAKWPKMDQSLEPHIEPKKTGRNMRAAPRSKSKVAHPVVIPSPVPRSVNKELLEKLTQQKQQQARQDELQEAARQLVNEAMSKADVEGQAQHRQDQEEAQKLLNEAFPLASAFRRSFQSEPGSQPASSRTQPGSNLGQSSAATSQSGTSALERILSDGSATGIPRYSGLRSIPRTDISGHDQYPRQDESAPSGRLVGGQGRGQGDVTMTAEEKEAFLKSVRGEINRVLHSSR